MIHSCNVCGCITDHFVELIMVRTKLDDDTATMIDDTSLEICVDCIKADTFTNQAGTVDCIAGHVSQAFADIMW